MPHFIPHFIANFASLSLVLLDETSVAAAEAVTAGVVETGVAATGNENAVVRAAMDNPDKFNFMVFPLNNLPRRNWLVAHMKLHLKNTLCLANNQ
jgi:hypothetical protein